MFGNIENIWKYLASLLYFPTTHFCSSLQVVSSFLTEGLNEKLTREKQTEGLSNILCIQCKLLLQSNTAIDDDGDDELSPLIIDDDDASGGGGDGGGGEGDDGDGFGNNVASKVSCCNKAIIPQ